jgi:hypothetical protein
MKEFIKIWEERKYGPRFAIAAIASIIVYLVVRS